MTCSILLFFFDLIGGDGAPLPKVEKIHSTSHSQPTTTSDWANGSSSGGGSSSGAGGGGVIEVTTTTAAAEVIAAVENKGEHSHSDVHLLFLRLNYGFLVTTHCSYSLT